MTRAIRTAAGSVAIACAVLALKLGAWTLTGSVALLADAAESVVNVAAALTALAAVRYSAIPPDANHPYGHTKAEYFSAVLEGALIVLAAIVILQEAWGAVLHPHAPSQPAAGLLVSAVATAINGVWAAVLFRRGRVAKSPALLADGRH
ncbi:MAG: cation diffusion facilitator family transporter, partial [Acetobacteraceae bacterium]|nr:cation diffusion facilitator family transporter [Acetobacteraceae bacterium]